MTAAKPLQGRRIVVTRPAAQAGPLAEAIGAAGGTALCFPLLEITALSDTSALRAVALRLADYQLAIFISPNAVNYAWPALSACTAWPASTRPAAVGPGTVKALSARGLNQCLAPQVRFDSEALLALPDLAAAMIRDARVVIFRGDGGRELLADTLRERGAQVDCIPCYRRSAPAAGFDAWLAAWQAEGIDAITLSSSEGLRYLWEGLNPIGREHLLRTPLFVPHARIAENARALGLREVILTAGADAGLLAGLHAYNWSAC